MKATNEITTEYIQFSKRITTWGVMLVTITLILCVSAIVFFSLPIETANIVSRLYSAYITVMGVTIGAY